FPFSLKLTPLSSIVTTNVLSSISISRLIGLLNFIEDSLRISSKGGNKSQGPTLGTCILFACPVVCPQQAATLTVDNNRMKCSNPVSAWSCESDPEINLKDSGRNIAENLSLCRACSLRVAVIRSGRPGGS